MSGEIYGYLMENLMAAGALDVYFTPIQMKKNRPAVQISVLCDEGDERRLSEILFRETTTLGVRMTRMARMTQPREIALVTCAYGQIRMKIAEGNAAPEYEDCARAARAHGVPLKAVLEEARRAHQQADREQTPPSSK